MPGLDRKALPSLRMGMAMGAVEWQFGRLDHAGSLDALTFRVMDQDIVRITRANPAGGTRKEGVHIYKGVTVLSGANCASMY